MKTYGYDDAFRITSITDADDSSRSQSYGYDLLDRLTSASGASLNQGWTYDANGNRLTQTGSQASTYNVSTSSNRLTSVAGALTRSYSYDAAGNTTGDGTATFTYNDSGRMASATKAGVTATYKLNALGQRVKKTISGASTYFVYDEAGHLVGEYDNGGALIQETVWFGDTPVATVRPTGGGVDAYYVHTDHLNTPRRISRPGDNAVVWRWDSDPFGTTAAAEDPDLDSTVFLYNLRLPGQYADTAMNLHYNYYRDYDPATGRYVESDPIGLEGGLNTYGYVGGRPTMLTDPTGLAPTKAVIWLVRICKTGIKKIRPVDFDEAVDLAKKGEDLQSSRKVMKQVGNSASEGRGALKDPAHPDKSTGSLEGRRPHYHVNPRNGGHLFYSIAAAVTVANYVDCEDCALGYLAEGVDFFNPLSLPKDLMDLTGVGVPKE